VLKIYSVTWVQYWNEMKMSYCQHGWFWGRWQTNKYVGIDWRTDERPPPPPRFSNKRTVVNAYRQVYRAVSLWQFVIFAAVLKRLKIPLSEAKLIVLIHWMWWQVFTAQSRNNFDKVNRESTVVCCEYRFDLLYSFRFACLSYSTVLFKDLQVSMYVIP
jgi:hypothetical protein